MGAILIIVVFMRDYTFTRDLLTTTPGEIKRKFNIGSIVVIMDTMCMGYSGTTLVGNLFSIGLSRPACVYNYYLCKQY